MIYHQDTAPERLKEQGIFHSHLYRAMAKHGIKNFKIDLVDECSDEELNNCETFWIEMYDSLSPKGYNLMSGGGANGHHAEVTKERISQTKRENVDNFRNPILQGLPPYTAYRDNPKKGGPMIRVNGHPFCPGKNFLVRDYDSLEATKQVVLAFLKDLESKRVIYSRPKIGGDEIAKLPGFCKMKSGYRVNILRDGKNYDRKFHSKNKTDNENKQAALEHYYALMGQNPK